MMSTAYQRYDEPGVAPSLRSPMRTLSDLLDAGLRQHGSDTATTFVLGYRGDGRLRLGGKLDYWRLGRHIERFANALYQLGVRKGDRVALALPSSPQFVIAFFGAVQIGAIVVTCDPSAPTIQIGERLADSGAETIVLLDTLWPALRSIWHLTALKRAVVATIGDTLSWLDYQLVSYALPGTLRRLDVPRDDRTFFFREMLHFQAPPPPPIALTPSDPALLHYTGDPDAGLRAATLTHATLVSNALQCIEVVYSRAIPFDRERVLSAVPFHEIYGLQAGMLCPLALGAELVIVPEPHSSEHLRAAAQHQQVTRYCAAPAPYRTIDDHQIQIDQRSINMSYELFLTAFDRAETADDARYWIHEYVRKDDLQVLDVVVLAKQADDSAVIQQSGDLGSQHGARIGAIVGGVLGVAGGPVGIAALGAAGAAFGALSELLASRDLYRDDLQEMEQALAPGTSALLALLAPEHVAMYARRIADFGGETMRFSLTNDDGQEFQDAKHAFVARQAERRREQLAAWSGTTADEAADLDAMNHELEQIYAAMGSAPASHQEELRVQAAALRTRRDAARELLNQTLAAEVLRLDEAIASYQEALSGATSDEERATLTAQNATLNRSRVAAEQQLAACQEAELQERWRDITALEAVAAGADSETRITLDLQLAELRDGYASARQARPTATARAA